MFIQLYINKTNSLLNSDYAFHKQAMSRITALALPVLEILAGIMYLQTTCFTAIFIPVKICVLLLYVVAEETNCSRAATTILQIYDLFPTFLTVLQSAGKGIICFANIFVGTFIGLIFPDINLLWHVECGLGKMPETKKITNFERVEGIVGMENVKEIFEDQVLALLRDPEHYKKYNLTIPNGILFYGPPGCGKTHIARNLAKSMKFHYQEIKPSTIASPYLHDTSRKINEVFEKALKNAPAVVFIDEFETIAPKRTGSDNSHNQHRNEEVAEFLKQLEACEGKNILVMAATNYPQRIDPAVIRPGRVDVRIYVGPPDQALRTKMLEFQVSNIPEVVDQVDFQKVAGQLEGCSASDIKLIVKNATFYAAKTRTKITTPLLLEEAKKIKPSLPKNVEEQYLKAYREALFLDKEEKESEDFSYFN